MDSKEKIYIVMDSKKSLDTDDFICVKDIGDVYCINNQLKKEIENIKVYKSEDKESWDYINDIDVIREILKIYPNTEIELSGSSETLLEIKNKEKERKILEFFKVSFVAITLFFGAALGIMYFHEDVNMSETLEKLYYTFTGDKKTNPLIMNIPYSIGLGIGMITFFSRIPSSSYRRSLEPGPMEIELYLYDKDMEDYILNDLKKQKMRK